MRCPQDPQGSIRSHKAPKGSIGIPLVFNKVPLGFIMHSETPTCITCSRFITFHRGRQGSTRFCWVLSCAEWFSEGSEKSYERTSANLSEPWLRTFFQIFWNLEEPWRPSEKLEGSLRTSANRAKHFQSRRTSKKFCEQCRTSENQRKLFEPLRNQRYSVSLREGQRTGDRGPQRTSENLRTSETHSA